MFPFLLHGAHRSQEKTHSSHTIRETVLGQQRRVIFTDVMSVKHKLCTAIILVIDGIFVLSKEYLSCPLLFCSPNFGAFGRDRRVLMNFGGFLSVGNKGGKNLSASPALR